jgi:adenine deaminase
MSPDEFRIPVEGDKDTAMVRAMGFKPGTALTDELIFEMPVTDGEIVANTEMDVAKVATIARQPHSGRIGLGLYKGLGLKKGAIGCTYHVNACNMGVIGMNDDDMAMVANRMEELGGGLVVVADGEILSEIPMPIVGLVTDEPVEKVLEDMREMKRILKEDLGVKMLEVGMLYSITLIFLPLKAPKLRITINGMMQAGMVDGKLVHTLVPIFVEEE